MKGPEKIKEQYEQFAAARSPVQVYNIYIYILTRAVPQKPIMQSDWCMRP
jgi:hypothetical protein